MSSARRTLAVGATYLAILVATAARVGYTRDEAFYIQFARVCEAWLERVRTAPGDALGRASIDATWTLNHEHPAFAKLLFAFGHLVLKHCFSADGTAYRFPAMLLAAVLVAAIHHHAARRWGAWPGVVAAGAVGFMPRFFFHAHLACLDVPVAAMTTLTALAYLRSLRTDGLRWPVATGVLFGLALATKHTAISLPAAMIAHVLVLVVEGQPVRRALRTIAAMAVLGLLTLVCAWPWLWHEPAARIAEWIAFHLGHEHYDVEYLGRSWWRPPFPRSYAWVMTLTTVPTITLVLAGLGILERTRRCVRTRRTAVHDPAREDVFLALCVIVFYAPWLSSSTPIFGGTKHWLAAYPFLALFAAAGFSRSVAALRSCAWLRRRRLVAMAVAASVLAAPIVESVHALPFALGAYAPLVGGAPGGASLGLQRGFWGYTTRRVASYLDREVARGGRVYLHDVAPLAFRLLQQEGVVRGDLVGTQSLDGADAALYEDQPHMHGQEYKIWDAFGTAAPADIDGLDGVPMVLVYQRPQTSPSDSSSPVENPAE